MRSREHGWRRQKEHKSRFSRSRSRPDWHGEHLTDQPSRPFPGSRLQPRFLFEPSPSAHPTLLAAVRVDPLKADAHRLLLPPSQTLGLGGRFAMLPPLDGAARRPSYVVIWHIASYWLLPGYSVRHPGPP